MTTKQLDRFYFPLWHKVREANDWTMQDGRLLAGPGLLEPKRFQADSKQLYMRIIATASRLAAAAGQAITPESLRHACHFVALGRDRSAKDLSNSELDRVAALFKILIDPDDVAATRDYLHPENQARKRLLYSIEHISPEGYTRHISADKFGTQDWENLTNAQLRQLLLTLRERRQNWASSADTSASSALKTPELNARDAKVCAEAANEPF